MVNGYQSTSERSQSGSFELSNGHGRATHGKCVSTSKHTVNRDKTLALDKTGLHLQDYKVDERNRYLFRCTLRTADGSDLTMDADWQSGSISGLPTLQITPIADEEDQPNAPGFLISGTSGPLGAVDLGRDATVIIRRELPAEQRDIVAAIAMTLLLRRDMF